MNKIYISADVEGLNGITSFRQVLPEFAADYAQMRPQLHLELNALIKGIKEAGVKNILVNDAHNTMTNINLSELDYSVQLISGKPKKVSMMYGLDETFDGIIFFAYHAKAGSAGVLAHTFNMYFKNVYLNDKKISEAQLNGIYAKTLNVPIILASGDNIFCEELKQDLGNIATIETKKAISNTAAMCNTNAELLLKYEEFGKNINNLEKFSYQTSPIYKLRIELEDDGMAKQISTATSLVQEENYICFTSKNYTEIYTTLQKISAETTLRKSQNQQV